MDALTASDKAWVLNEAVLALRSQGRSTEALPAMRAARPLMRVKPFPVATALVDGEQPSLSAPVFLRKVGLPPQLSCHR